MISLALFPAAALGQQSGLRVLFWALLCVAASNTQKLLDKIYASHGELSLDHKTVVMFGGDT
jgi:hypothetical protein